MAGQSCDVLVVGAGNAALCAALAARERGADVLVLEAAPPGERGGNSRYTGGMLRLSFGGVEDLEPLYGGLSEEEKAATDFGRYGDGDFLDDLGRVTQYRAHPDLAEVMVGQSLPSFHWLGSKGVRFAPPFGRQAYRAGDRLRFWGGVAVEVRGGGEAMVEALFNAAEREGVRIRYRTRALRLIEQDGAVRGVKARCEGRQLEIRAGAVVLAAGGFQANAEWRTRYLGPGWDLAKVRGTRYNVGDGIRMALEVGAMPFGQWSGCHAVGWDRNAPDFGDLRVGDGFQKHSYPLGLMLNRHGRRFVDEGADFRSFTYAKYGRAVLEQPGQTAWQVFDGKALPLLRDEYRIRRVTRVRADTLEQLFARMEDIDAGRALATVAAFNAAVMDEVPFNPGVKDGRGTRGLDIPKSNWALALDEPPFEAYGITCGITFTFGGLRIDTHAEVLDIEERPIPGLYAAGELVGGLFYFNYPSGSGLTSGTVFGRIAGDRAARAVKRPGNSAGI